MLIKRKNVVVLILDNVEFGTADKEAICLEESFYINKRYI